MGDVIREKVSLRKQPMPFYGNESYETLYLPYNNIIIFNSMSTPADRMCLE